MPLLLSDPPGSWLDDRPTLRSSRAPLQDGADTHDTAIRPRHSSARLKDDGGALVVAGIALPTSFSAAATYTRPVGVRRSRPPRARRARVAEGRPVPAHALRAERARAV